MAKRSARQPLQARDILGFVRSLVTRGMHRVKNGQVPCIKQFAQQPSRLIEASEVGLSREPLLIILLVVLPMRDLNIVRPISRSTLTAGHVQLFAVSGAREQRGASFPGFCCYNRVLLHAGWGVAHAAYE
jgi:hypothetical protein